MKEVMWNQIIFIVSHLWHVTCEQATTHSVHSGHVHDDRVHDAHGHGAHVHKVHGDNIHARGDKAREHSLLHTVEYMAEENRVEVEHSLEEAGVEHSLVEAGVEHRLVEAGGILSNTISHFHFIMGLTKMRVKEQQVSYTSVLSVHFKCANENPERNRL